MTARVVDGVLIPAEKRDLPHDELVAYAAKVREGNGAFIDAYWKLEDQAIALGHASLDALVDEAVVHEGPWWCPTCSRAHASTLDTNHGEPCCPKCGNALEEQGTGDDDPDA